MRLLFALLISPSLLASDCEGLASLSLPNTTITKAELVAPGGFEVPGLPPAQQGGFRQLPGFCRVAATVRPTPDSEIKMEVWMPSRERWNGKFMGVGNGGWSGSIVYPALSVAVNRGYAAASTNTGHDGGTAEFALGHPEKLADFGYRAVHEMTVKGKAITAALYDKGPEKSYWNGCSSGGKQGLKEAQKFPDDYDGIIAGAPANYWTHLMIGDLWPAYVSNKTPGSALSPGKLKVLHEAALAACDARDGVKDGLIEDPAQCKFDPATVACKGAETDVCLTAAQVESARKIYAGAKFKGGKPIFPGMVPGSELVWPALAGAKPFAIPMSHFQVVVFKDTAWDYLSLDFDRDIKLADKIDNGLLNATDPDLKPFFARGGKLLMYHGWNDQLITPLNSVDYYNSVVKKMGGVAKIDDSYRLFMAPAMNHCSGGDGPFRADYISVIDDWVTKGKAPEKIVAEHVTANKVDRSRPLCPYPQVAKYSGSGSSDESSNFTCVAPGK
jgi:feruloyl esterase